MVRNIIRWLATIAAIWNGLFLAWEGLWLWPRTVGIDPWIESAPIVVACFLPVIGGAWAVLKPRSGALLILAAVASYLLAYAIRVVELLVHGESIPWVPQPFYMFVVPSSIFAVAIFLTAGRKPSSFHQDTPGSQGRLATG